MLTALIFVAIGVLALAKGADWLVDGAGSLARRLGIAPIVIGLTVVAFGTSMPELVVNLLAAHSGNVDIAIGNVIGSNIANILLILGIAAMIRPLTIKLNTVWKEIPLALLAVALVAVMASDVLLAGNAVNALDRIDGIVLLSFFAVFMYYTFGISKAEGETDGDEMPAQKSVGMSVGLVAAGLAALMLGGKLTVDGAVAIAQALGVTERLIGLTVVAVGTSLPELVTSAVAARKGQTDIAVGNVVGSNIFNVFLILGITSTWRSLPFSTGNASDVLVAVVATLLLFIALFVGRKHLLERWQGAAFVGTYVAYVAFLVVTG